MTIRYREPTDTVQLKLRMREDLRHRLEFCAYEKRISINAEIIQRLETSYKADDERAIVRGIGLILAEIRALRSGNPPPDDSEDLPALLRDLADRFEREDKART